MESESRGCCYKGDKVVYHHFPTEHLFSLAAILTIPGHLRIRLHLDVAHSRGGTEMRTAPLGLSSLPMAIRLGSSESTLISTASSIVEWVPNTYLLVGTSGML